jgi:hypothetical protein
MIEREDISDIHDEQSFQISGWLIRKRPFNSDD